LLKLVVSSEGGIKQTNHPFVTFFWKRNRKRQTIDHNICFLMAGHKGHSVSFMKRTMGDKDNSWINTNGRERMVVSR